MQPPFLHEQPFTRLVFPLILGILLQAFFMPPLIIISTLLALLFVLFIISFSFKNLQWEPYLNGGIIILIFFSLGLLVANLNKVNSNYSQKSTNEAYVAKIIEVPIKKNNSYKTNLQLTAKHHDNLWWNHDQMVLAYFEDDSVVSKLKAGNEIVFSSELKEVAEPKNPFEFNFKRYLELKNIQQSTYLNSDDWIVLSEQEKGLKQLALNIRQKLIAQFENAGIQGEQLAVFSALTLGYKNKLDAKLKSAYSGAGAMHVLAVSGMHVGIIFFVLDWFFKLITFFNKKNRLKYLLIILSLWAYALVTGLSPSVLRSTIMITFILFGYLLNKRPKVYNSLSASALLLLLINPNYLFDVGFQLSYTAVAGIVFFYPRIYKLIHVPIKVLNGIWQLTAVSLSAQLATFPIAIFYFKQFATYFWLSNIIVSLSAIILLFSAVLLVVSTPFPIISGLVGQAVNKYIEILNQFIFKVNALPHSVIHDINYNQVQVILIYLAIAFGVSWLIYKKTKILLYALSLLLGLIIYNDIDYLNRSDRKQLCIYNLPRASAIQLINNQTGYWITKNKSHIDSSFIRKANNYWGINSNSELNIGTQEYLFNNNFLVFHNYMGLIIDENTRPFGQITSDNLSLDFILIRGNPSLAFNDIPKNLIVDKIVIDASVLPWKVKNWLNQDNVCVHQTKSDGMFLLSSIQ